MVEQQNSIDWQKLAEIFFPSIEEKRHRAFPLQTNSDNERTSEFAHYTSAESALKIIESKELWMRNALLMNDYNEIQNGINLINKYLSYSNKRNEFFESLKPCGLDLFETIKNIDSWLYAGLSKQIFIFSFSEHNSHEDRTGRLSMWRAYGGNISRIAIIFKAPWQTRYGMALGINFSPVLYFNQEDVNLDMNVTVKNINANIEFLQKMKAQKLEDYLFWALLGYMVCLKHRGFCEEKEWRAVHIPFLNDRSSLIKNEIQTIGGVPQEIHRLPMKGKNEEEYYDFKTFFKQLIIGPSLHPEPIKDVFIKALEQAGIENAKDKVIISDIPLRI